MKELIYVTGNFAKLRLGEAICEPLGIHLQQTKLELQEIQAETGEPVARDKAVKAFTELGKPLVVTDDNWMIPGLNNFPGPYMHAMNTWFSPEDWLHLTSKLTDRRIILRQILVYQDAHEQKLFAVEIEGMLMREKRGESPYTHCTVTSFDGGKTSNAEHHERNASAAVGRHNVWHEFTEWYAKEHT